MLLHDRKKQWRQPAAGVPTHKLSTRGIVLFSSAQRVCEWREQSGATDARAIYGFVVYLPAPREQPRTFGFCQNFQAEFDVPMLLALLFLAR